MPKPSLRLRSVACSSVSLSRAGGVSSRHVTGRVASAPAKHLDAQRPARRGGGGEGEPDRTTGAVEPSAPPDPEGALPCPSAGRSGFLLRAAPCEGSTARERLVVHGAECLGDDELVACTLGGRDALVRARALLDHVGGLRGLAEAFPSELVEVAGIGEAAALALAATTELARRLVRASAPKGMVLRNPEDVVEFVRAELVAATREHFLAIGLDARQRLRLVRTIAVGSLAQVDVHPRELFRPLVRAGIHSAILVHNHPSGDPRPSEADLTLTRRMIEVGRLVGIPVLDHLIVCEEAHVSLAALGLVT